MAESKLFRVLASSVVIDSKAFAKATPTEQTAAISGHKKPIVFVESFLRLGNKVTLRDKLLRGDDASLELEYNGIELTGDEKAALIVVNTMTTRILGEIIDNGYPWKDAKSSTTAARTLCFGDTLIRDALSSYELKVSLAEAFWKRVSPRWAKFHSGRIKRFSAPNSQYELIGAEGTKRVYYYKEYITIGCQTIDRFYLEQAAKHYGWEVPVQ